MWNRLIALMCAGLMFSACGQDETEKLRKENEELKAKVQSLTADVKRLSETDQTYFSLASDDEKASDIDGAIASYEALLSKFPASSLVPEAKKRLQAAKNIVAASRGEADKALKQMTKRLASAPDATAASTILDEIASKYPFPDVKEAVDRQRGELKEKIAKEQQASESLKALGVEFSNIRTYWTIENDVLGGKRLIIPFIRLTVKNIGATPITRLSASASFDLVEKKEMLGEGSTYVISMSDPPLKPGYTKEVFFGSATGYVDSGMGEYSQKPTMTADLYLETDQGEKRLVKTIKISKEFQSE